MAAQLLDVTLSSSNILELIKNRNLHKLHLDSNCNLGKISINEFQQITKFITESQSLKELSLNLYSLSEKRRSLLMQAIADSISIQQLKVEWIKITINIEDDDLSMQEKEAYGDYAEYLNFECFMRAIALNKSIVDFQFGHHNYRPEVMAALKSQLVTRFPNFADTNHSSNLFFRMNDDTKSSAFTPGFDSYQNSNDSQSDRKSSDETHRFLDVKPMHNDLDLFESAIISVLDAKRPKKPKGADYCCGFRSDFEDLVMPKSKAATTSRCVIL